jgi:hypothetical protein
MSSIAYNEVMRMLMMAIEERKNRERVMEAWRTVLSSRLGHEAGTSGG